MRQFYSAYKDNSKLQPFVGEISWTKKISAISRRDDKKNKVFGVAMARVFISRCGVKLSEEFAAVNYI